MMVFIYCWMRLSLHCFQIPWYGQERSTIVGWRIVPKMWMTLPSTPKRISAVSIDVRLNNLQRLAPLPPSVMMMAFVYCRMRLSLRCFRIPRYGQERSTIVGWRIVPNLWMTLPCRPEWISAASIDVQLSTKWRTQLLLLWSVLKMMTAWIASFLDDHITFYL